ncbi:MAG: biotin transporter BioY [Clostridia bacterium]|nr:biotin transporter BioY [Clostridia bacterium]
MNQTASVKSKKPSVTTADIAFVALSAAIITICAWISIPTVVPFTLQTFAVFAISGIFGLKRSVLSMGVYLLLAAIGVPVLSGFKGGFDKLVGTTGGYILGFVFIAVIVGYTSDRFGRRVLPLVLSMLLGLLLCYTFGTAWFMLIYARTSGSVGLGTVLGWCVLPFILPDCIKLACAVALANRVGKYVKA